MIDEYENKRILQCNESTVHGLSPISRYESFNASTGSLELTRGYFDLSINNITTGCLNYVLKQIGSMLYFNWSNPLNPLLFGLF